MITCDCSVFDYDYDTMDFSETKIVKARKAHKCCECREEIKPGEQYEHAKGVYDGSWSSWKTCITCTRIRRDYCPNGWLYEGLEETIYECLGFWYTEVPE